MSRARPLRSTAQDQGALLLAVEPAGRRLDLPDRFGGGDLRCQALGGGPGQERPQGGELAVDRGGLELEGVAEVGLPLAELGGGQRPEVGAFLVGLLVPVGEGEEVVAVVLLGMAGPLVVNQVGGEPGEGLRPVGVRGGRPSLVLRGMKTSRLFSRSDSATSFSGLSGPDSVRWAFPRARTLTQN